MDTVIVKMGQFHSHYPKDIAKGTVNAEEVLVQLDEEWEGLTVNIHWRNVSSGVEKNPQLNRDMPNAIPWEVLTDIGELHMGLVGLNGDTVIKPTIWLTYGNVVEGVNPEAGEDPQPPTPSWEQQMVALAEASAKAAKAAKETADNLQAAAEAGEFDGDPGPEGPPGKSPIIKDRTWWIWSVEDQAYKDTGILASGGGGGGVSYNDLSDRPRIGGVLLEGDKTAEVLNLQTKGDYAEKTDIPSTLPSPYTLTFAGAVEAAYDGSQAVTVTIPTVAGPPGVSPTVATEEIDGGTRVTFTFKGGSETVDILDGTTPVKGVDYFTPDEIQSIAEQAAALVPGGGSEPELIFDYTVEGEAVALVEVSEDMSKKPFRFRKVFIFVDIATASDIGTGSGTVWLFVGGESNARRISFTAANAYTTKRGYGGYFFGMDGFCVGRFAAADMSQTATDEINGIPYIQFKCTQPDTFQFQPGTVFKIYGEGRIE